MKIVPVLLSFFALLFVGCDKPNLDDPETLDKILESALEYGDIQFRGKDGDERLMYAKNSQTPYTGWINKIDKKTGQLLELVQAKDGRVQRKAYWSKEDGVRVSETNLKDGKPHGLQTYFWDNGQKERESNWKDGKLHGVETYYDENGQKFKEVNWKDDFEIK